ncbi:MAG: hypothetical protein Q9220_005395 [cf. Caloplaca sp. 1 TL-2023]
MTSCSHTFCSLCIRRCLTNDGKCPACRAPDQELRLRHNWVAQEFVEAFKIARPSLCSLVAQVANQRRSTQPRSKRKIEDTDFESDSNEPVKEVPRRKTRSMDHRHSRSLESAAVKSPEIKGQEVGRGSYEQQMSDPRDEPETEDANENDGLAECPICAKRMKEEAVFLHLDTHNDVSEVPEKLSLRRKRSPSVEILGRARTKTKPPERLPQLNYSLMKDGALRKKLAELGIPNTGPRNLLIRRHAEWVNIVNANADSSKPKMKREMIRELDSWDRSTGRSIANGNLDSSMAGSIMDKDFDGATWSLDHSSNFRELISKARHTGKAVNGSARSRSPSHTPEQRRLHEPTAPTDCQPLSDTTAARPTSITRNSADHILSSDP